MTQPNIPRTPESVWDYPRPPKLEPANHHLRVVHNSQIIAETHQGLRILETSHPPVYYFPPNAIALQFLRPGAQRQSFCEFKGLASYWDLVIDNSIVRDVAWSYPNPSRPYAALKDHLAFYATRANECWVDEERVVPQPGDFYGGWITSHIRGPFKGTPGTMHW